MARLTGDYRHGNGGTGKDHPPQPRIPALTIGSDRVTTPTG